MNIRQRLQAQVAQAIISGFEMLGGDPVDAVIAAKKHETVEDWIHQETTMIAIAGGAGMVIPGLGGLTLAAGMAYLLHKLAVICWGIGAHKSAYIVEKPQFLDLLNILTLWVAGKNNLERVERMAIHLDAFFYAVTDEGYAALEAAIDALNAEASAEAPAPHVANALYALRTLADGYASDEQAQRLLAALSDENRAKAALMAARSRENAAPKDSPRHTGDPLLNALGGKINQETAMQIAVALLADVPLRLIMGLLPGVGAMLNAMLNAQVMRAVADAASAYYEAGLSIQTQQNRVQYRYGDAG